MKSLYESILNVQGMVDQGNDAVSESIWKKKLGLPYGKLNSKKNVFKAGARDSSLQITYHKGSIVIFTGSNNDPKFIYTDWSEYLSEDFKYDGNLLIDEAAIRAGLKFSQIRCCKKDPRISFTAHWMTGDDLKSFFDVVPSGALIRVDEEECDRSFWASDILSKVNVVQIDTKLSLYDAGTPTYEGINAKILHIVGAKKWVQNIRAQQVITGSSVIDIVEPSGYKFYNNPAADVMWKNIRKIFTDNRIGHLLISTSYFGENAVLITPDSDYRSGYSLELIKGATPWKKL